ncbi:MAG TPA: NF038122 family metalloprotease [Stellaceae bacterium]|jgi:hypothetical protein|nr:NF038122 family metalloprotease [Stellaceae bacterium]
MAGLKINVTYGASVTALQSTNAALYAQYTNAIQTAVNYFQSAIVTPITVTITFGWGEAGGTPITAGTGGASSTFIFPTTYAQLLVQAKAALTTSPIQVAALASLPQTDPTSGAAFSIATAEAAALGFDTTGYTIGGGAGLSSTMNWAWTQNNIPAGASDAIGTLEHEISEVLGRSDSGGKDGQYSFLDMFRYTAANGLSTNPIGAQAGVRDQPFVGGYNANAPSYFSYNGTTNTLVYETPENVAGGSDVGDWSPAVPSDSFGDANTTATPDLVSPTDLATMNVLGYTLTGSALPANLGGAGKSGILMTNNATGALVLVGSKTDLTASYQQIGGIGTEWQIAGYGDFLGDGADGFLMYDTKSGAIVVGEDDNGTAQYIQVGAVGSEWSFVGAGQFAGQATSDFLLRNNNGTLVVGAVTGGAAAYTAIGGIGSDWSINGTGDLLGDGQTGFLMEQTNGTLVVGEDVGGTAHYTAIGGIGPEWNILGTGDLLDDGQDDFLMRSSASGALVVGEVVGGAAQYTQVGGIGSEWEFLGIGDYDGASNAEFAMLDTHSGALVIGTVLSGSASYQQIGGVGVSDWTFHVPVG